MSTKPVVTMLKHGNMLCLEPTTDRIVRILQPVLTFQEKKIFYGYEAKQRKRLNLSPIEFINHVLFEADRHQRLTTTFGFWKLIRDELRQHGYEVRLKDQMPGDAKKFEPHWENIQGYQLREGQPEFLQKVLTHRCGRFDCAPGFGKSFMIGLIASLFPRAKIDVITRRVSVLRDRIYPELVQMVGDVGIVGGSKKELNRRVMCYTADSAHHSPATADIMIGDEIQELATDRTAAQLVRWQNSRNFGLSASHDKRFDGRDLRMHGIFGPIIFSVSYQQAQQAKLVVPIHVIWSNVRSDYDPCESREDIEKKRYGIWCNDFRNDTIARDARLYDRNTQVLITVDTLEHAMQLKKRLPEFTLVYRESGLTPKTRQDYVNRGCCSQDEPLMDVDRRIQLTQDFEKGRLKKVICTTVWNVGVSFNQLTVLIRAAGGSSVIGDIQIPGRVSRVAEGKEYGIVHDYRDQFNPKMASQAKGRESTYVAMGFEQIKPPTTALDSQLM